MAGSNEGAIDLRALTRRPGATFLWGPHRALVNRVLYTLARANDPDFYWNDLRELDEVIEEDDPLSLGWVPEDHLFRTQRASDARPQDALGNLALWTFVRTDDPASSLTRISDFLRLPDLVQEAVARLVPHGGPRVVACANTDRVREYYPVDRAGVRGVINGFLEGGVSPMMSALSPPGEGRWAFEFVVEVRAGRPDPVRDATRFCEQTAADTAFRAGTETPLARISGFEPPPSRPDHRSPRRDPDPPS